MSQDPHSLQALKARYGPRQRWYLLYTLMLGSMAAVMSSTIMNVGIPDMSHHFTLSQSRVQWVTSGFMVAMTVSMLTTPWLLARFGYRRVYEVCMWLLLGGGVMGGFASDFVLVMAARVAEGLAAGVVQPIPAIIILRAFDSSEQGRASGLFGMGVVLAPAIGPSIGGVLVDVFGWRSIFFMVVPLALLALWLSRRFVPTTAPGGVAANADSQGLDRLGLGDVGAVICAHAYGSPGVGSGPAMGLDHAGAFGAGIHPALAQPRLDAGHTQRTDPASLQCHWLCTHVGRCGRCQRVCHRAGMASIGCGSGVFGGRPACGQLASFQ